MTDATTTAPADEPEIEEEEAERRAPFWQRLVAGSSTWIGLILIALILVFSALEYSSFVSSSNARNIATDAAVLLVLATGMTYVIITAGIDLSVGAVLVFSGVVSAKAMNAAGGDNWGVIILGLVVALLAGAAWGLINGFLVAKAKIPPFVVTLGTLGMSLGFGVILAATRFGRYTYAVGSNEEAARRAGIPVDRHLIKIYALAGTLAGLAGFLSLARFSTTTIGGHDTDNLAAIAGVVIGGTSLFGGIGTMLGSVFGVFIPAVLQNGFVIVGVQPFWQQIAVGAVLIGAVYLDQLRRRSQYQR